MKEKDTRVDKTRIEIQSGLGDITGDMYHDNADIQKMLTEKLHQFKQDIIKTQKKELLEAVEGMRKKETYENPRVFSGENGSVLSNSNTTNAGYNQALDDIKNLLSTEE